jgi:hypothetical protein
MLHSENDIRALAVPLPALALAVQHTSVVGAGVGIAGADGGHAMTADDVRRHLNEFSRGNACVLIAAHANNEKRDLIVAMNRLIERYRFMWATEDQEMALAAIAQAEGGK